MSRERERSRPTELSHGIDPGGRRRSRSSIYK